MNMDEQSMVDLLNEILWAAETEGALDGSLDIQTFREAQLMTLDKGLVVELGGSQFQITVKQSR